MLCTPLLFFLYTALMVFHYPGRWKHSCALLISVQYGSEQEAPITRGLTHFAEHLMFCATDDFAPGPLADAMHDLTNGVEATTSRKNMRLWTHFHRNDTREVLHLLSQMLHHWQCPITNLEEERDILLREWDEYQESGDGEQLDRMHRLMDVQSLSPLGSRAFVKGIGQQVVQLAKKHWHNAVLQAPTNVIALGAFNQAELETIANTFNRSFTKKRMVQWKGSIGTFRVKKTMAGLFYEETTPHPLAVLLDRIYYWRWSHALSFSGYRMYSVKSKTGFFLHNRTKALSRSAAEMFFRAGITKQEFDHAKRMLLQYWEGTLDILDTKDTLYWFDGFDEYHYGQWGIRTPLDAYKFYKSASYKDMQNFHQHVTKGMG